MSKGPGAIERRVADLLAATRDRALSVVEIIDHAFQLGGRTPTRAQRISATRAAHRVLRRVRDMMARTASSSDEAERKRLYEASERIGFCSRIVRMPEKGPDWLKIEIDYWQATTLKGRLWLHLPDVPVQVWAVTIDRQGVHWFDTKITKITERNVMVRYHGVTARLDRQKLYRWWALFRNVMFVSSRTGRIAAELDALWQRRYGASGGDATVHADAAGAGAASARAQERLYARGRACCVPAEGKDSSPSRWRHSRDVPAPGRGA